MKTYYLSILLITIFFTSSCKKKAQLDPEDFPVIISGEIEYTSDSSITANADIFGNMDDIINFGFVWALDENYLFSDRSSLIEFKSKPSKQNRIEINYDLAYKKSYFLRSFLKTEDQTIYGNLIEFKTDKLKSPWTKMSNFGGSKRFKAVVFTINDYAYLGLGTNDEIEDIFYSDFWLLSPAIQLISGPTATTAFQWRCLEAPPQGRC